MSSDNPRIDIVECPQCDWKGPARDPGIQQILSPVERHLANDHKDPIFQITIPSAPLVPERAMALKKMSNVLHNAAGILESLSENGGRDWRSDARIALSHTTQAQVELATWLSDQDSIEAKILQDRASWSKP